MIYQPIKIGVSRCLLGEPVRYDGKYKYSFVCDKDLGELFEMIPVCPEVEAGLSVPREPVELVQYSDGIKAVGRDNKTVDVTNELQRFCDKKVPLLSTLSGFVFTPRSPSCGLDSTPLKSSNGEIMSIVSGLFAQKVVSSFPFLPVIEEPSLANKHSLLTFKLQVTCYSLVQLGKSALTDVSNLKPFSLLNIVLSDMAPSSKMLSINQLLSNMSSQEQAIQLEQLMDKLNA